MQSDITQQLFDRIFKTKQGGCDTLSTLLGILRDGLKRSKYYMQRPGTANQVYHQFNYLFDQLGLGGTPSVNGGPKMKYELTPTVSDFLQTIKHKNFGSPTLKHFTFQDLNVGVKDILPEAITDTLWPLNVNTGHLNFYNSFCMGYLTCHNGGTLFQRAVAHRAITQPDEFLSVCEIFQENPDKVLESIRNGNSTTHTEIALLSKIVDRNITVFEFSESGKIESDCFYDLTNHGFSKAPTNYLGCFAKGATKNFFPLVRKHGMKMPPPEAQTSAVVNRSKQSFLRERK